MNVRIVSRNGDLPVSVVKRAEQLVGKLSKYDSRLTEAEVIFEEQKRTKKVEAILHLDRVDHIVAKATDSEFLPALDQLVSRLQRQLRDGRARATSHQASKS
jgi:ribosomal subunit interface protein